MHPRPRRIGLENENPLAFFSNFPEVFVTFKPVPTIRIGNQVRLRSPRRGGRFRDWTDICLPISLIRRVVTRKYSISLANSSHFIELYGNPWNILGCVDRNIFYIKHIPQVPGPAQGTRIYQVIIKRNFYRCQSSMRLLRH